MAKALFTLERAPHILDFVVNTPDFAGADIIHNFSSALSLFYRL